MPCVLPVLLLKLTGVLDLTGRGQSQLRGAFLSTAAGIVTSFLVLAGGLAALKLAGASVGWGIQFQQPAFLALMAIVCLMFAANVWGLFQIPMPAFVGRAAVASDARAGNEHAKSFFTGVLATALATPCSAPFVGTAVGFALSRGTTEIFSIFLALGLGLALPYIAVAAAPQLVGFLPRPGALDALAEGAAGPQPGRHRDLAHVHHRGADGHPQCGRHDPGRLLLDRLRRSGDPGLRRQEQGGLRRRHRRLVHHLPGQQEAGDRPASRSPAA